MDDELHKMRLAYATERLAQAEAELRKAEAALGGRINRQNWRDVATAVADVVREGGDPELAGRYLATLERLNAAIEQHAEASEEGKSEADLDAAQAAQDDAEEEHERAAADLRAWFESLARKGGA
jgi:hypothetical protein